MSSDFDMKKLEYEIKKLGWKKNSVVFYKEINSETIASFIPFINASNKLSYNIQIVNKELNFVKWKVFGVDNILGKIKDHLLNGHACELTNIMKFMEVGLENLTEKNAALLFTNATEELGEKFSDIDRIYKHMVEIGRAHV